MLEEWIVRRALRSRAPSSSSVTGSGDDAFCEASLSEPFVSFFSDSLRSSYSSSLRRKRSHASAVKNIA